MRAVIMGMMLAVPTVAVAKPTVLRARQVYAESIHIANQGGAINRGNSVAVRVTLDGKAARVVATGDIHESNLYVSASGSSSATREETEWTTTWKGSFLYAKQALHLDLTLQKHACKHWKQSRDGAPHDVLECEKPSAHALLTCSRAQVEGDRGETADKAATYEVWQCAPSDATTELGETPAGWDLGLTGCLERSGNGLRGGFRYQPCGT